MIAQTYSVKGFKFERSSDGARSFYFFRPRKRGDGFDLVDAFCIQLARWSITFRWGFGIRYGAQWLNRFKLGI